jgi:hypothetical protein
MRPAKHEDIGNCIIFFPFICVEINGIWDCLRLVRRVHRDLMAVEQFERRGISLPLVPAEIGDATADRARVPIVLVLDDEPQPAAAGVRRKPPIEVAGAARGP